MAVALLRSSDFPTENHRTQNRNNPYTRPLYTIKTKHFAEKKKLRELPKDIISEMKTRFDSDLISANKILAEYLTEYDHLDSDRIIRCVIFLTENGIENFEKNLILAKTDPRDVMFWAEYENHNENQPNRIRDFNKTFSKNGV